MSLICADTPFATAKILKRFVRQPRPAGARKFAKTYGMPSTHSCTIAYFGVYLALSTLLLSLHPRFTSLLPFYDSIAARALTDGPSLLSTWTHSGTRLFLALFWVAGAASVCWSRVRLGHHTPAQVFAGAALGSAVAAVWLALWLGLEEVGVARLVGGSQEWPKWLLGGARETGLRWERAVEDAAFVVFEAWESGNWADLQALKDFPVISSAPRPDL